MKSPLPISTLAALPLLVAPLVVYSGSGQAGSGQTGSGQTGSGQTGSDLEGEPALIPLLPAVPADAALFLSITDLAALQADASENAWAQLLRDQEMLAVWSFVREALEEQTKDPFDADPEDPFAKFAQFAESVQGSALAFMAGTDLDDPSFGFLLQPGAGREQFEDFLAEAELESETESTYEDYGDVSLAISDAEDEDGDGVFGTDVEFDLDGVWCYSHAANRERALALSHGVIDRLRGSEEPSIATSAGLAAARAGSAPARIELFVDTHRLIEGAQEVTDEIDADGMRAFELIGLPEITWVHATADLGPGEELDVHLRMPTPKAGYMTDWMATFGPLPQELAALGPIDSLSAALYNIDFFAIYESAWDLFAELNQEAYDQVRAAFDGGLQQFGGLDLEGDLLAQLTGEMAVYVLPVPEEELQEIPGVVLPEDLHFGPVYVVGLEDGSTVELFIEEALNSVGMMLGISAASIDTEDFQGFAVQSLGLPTGMSFSWCFTDDHAVLSLYPSALRSVLALHGKEDAPSILTSELFAPYIQQYAGASGLGLSPSETTARMGFSMARMISDMLGSEDSVWDNLDGGEQVGWPFADVPIPDGSLASRYLEGTMIFKLEHADARLEMSFMAR